MRIRSAMWSVFLFAALLGQKSLALPVEIDTGDFAGKWDIDVSGNFFTGPMTVDLSPGFHQLRFGTVGIIGIEVDASGVVSPSSADFNSSIVGGQNELTVQTIPVSVHVGQYDGLWDIGRVREQAAGSDVVHLVPSDESDGGVPYRFSVGVRSSAFIVRLAGDGALTIDNADAAASGTPAEMSFGNTTVFVQDQQGSGAQWKISQVTSLRVGNDNVTLVPGLQYGLVVNGVTKFFSVAEPCAVSPTTLDYSGIGFRVSCGALDSDEDGVPDETDNCPLDPNPDQLDLNLDGEGDVCDLDDDGDGFEDSVDNCPQVENTDQGDLDGDGVGDACDGDDDGDGVENDTDLCAFSPNGTLVDSDGCTGPQRIARLCERTRFVQHGQYVRCVAQAANDAAADGLITTREKALFVKEAAKNR